ncbi:hypothetical protein BC830DRAFT_1094198 [Chytriomyces sp. MP71]|nr:hypothetical protein BC830DRAFT_1094198 [Chytriomyces sp. MP71]
MAPLGLNLDLGALQATASSSPPSPLLNIDSSALQNEQALSPVQATQLPPTEQPAVAQPPASSPTQTFVGWDGQIHSVDGQWHHFTGNNGLESLPPPPPDRTFTGPTPTTNSAAIFFPDPSPSTATALASVTPMESATPSYAYTSVNPTSAAENPIHSNNAEAVVSLSTAKGIGIAALITFLVGILFCVHRVRRKIKKKVEHDVWTPPPLYRRAWMDAGTEAQNKAGGSLNVIHNMASTNSRLSQLRTYPTLYELATKSSTMPRTSIEGAAWSHHVQLPVQLPHVVAGVNEEESLGAAIQKRLSIMPSFAEAIYDDDESYMAPAYRIPRSSIFIDDSHVESLAEAVNKRISRIADFSNFAGTDDELRQYPTDM